MTIRSGGGFLRGVRQDLRALLAGLCTLLGAGTSLAQSGEWLTFGHDPERSGWATEEQAFSVANVGQLGILWKTIVPNQPVALNGLTVPLVMRNVRTGRGNRNLVIVAGSSDRVFALDAENGELVWRFDYSSGVKAPSNTGWQCPSSLNATPVVDREGGRVFVVTSDGRLHTLALGDGHALNPRMAFVRPFSKMWSLNYSHGVIYTPLSQGCGSTPSGIAALNPDAPGRPVVNFFSNGGGSGAGIFGRAGVAVDFSGYVYGATGDGAFDPAAGLFGSTVVKLSPAVLQLAGYYAPENTAYISKRDLDLGNTTPVIFRWHDRVLAAVGGKESRLYLLDTATLSHEGQTASVYVSPRFGNLAQSFEGKGIWGALSVWADPGGDVWLYAPLWGPLAGEEVKFPLTNGPVTSGSVLAFKVNRDASGSAVLTSAWVSRDIAVPDPVAIAGDVVFVLGTGENTVQVQGGIDKHNDITQIVDADILEDRGASKGNHATLYALDARSGRELWSSGTAIAGWTHFSGLAVGDGKVFASTHDGAVYAFGFGKMKKTKPLVRDYSEPPPSSPSAAPPPAAEATPKPDPPRCGHASLVFQQRCATCHDTGGRGIAAVNTPNFTDPVWQRSKPDAELVDALTNGRLGGMPSFEGSLTGLEIDQLVHCVVRGFASSEGHARN